MISRRSLETATALLTGAFGAAVAISSLDNGIGWSAAGVDAGTFPFIIGLIILAGSLFNLVKGCVRRHRVIVLAVTICDAAGGAVYSRRGLCRRHSADRLLSRFGRLYVRRPRTAAGIVNLVRSPLIAIATPIALYLIFELTVPGLVAARRARRRARLSDGAAHGKSRSRCCTALPSRCHGNHIFLMLIGVLLGILVGVLPGLGAPNGVSLLLPLTFGMQPVSAIILLSSMYWGALFGGSVTSILFNIPGEPSSVATTFDGYPMARDGGRRRRWPPRSARPPSARWPAWC